MNDKGFLGETLDPVTSLVYLNARYHDPSLGMFLSVDPMVTTTGEPYGYASGNPASLSDPTGLCSVVHGELYCGGENFGPYEDSKDNLNPYGGVWWVVPFIETG